MQTVGLSVILGADFSSAEEAMAKFRQSVNNLASETTKAFANMAGTAANIGNAFKPVSDGAKNATQVVINESKARVQADNELTQWAINSSRLRIQAIRDEAAESRKTTAAKRKEKDEYGQLVADSNNLVRAYYNAAAAAIRMKDSTEETAAKLKEMAAAALAGQEQLKSIEAGAGRFQRNVGNYSGAMTFLRQSISQISGEIPNFFQSMRVGFMAIGNNIGQVLEAIRLLRAENVKLAASGEPTKNIFREVAASFLGWQTILFVGVGLISRYGAQMVEFIQGTISAKSATEKLSDAQKDLYDKNQSGSKSLEDYANKMKAVDDIMQTSVGTAGEQVGKIKALTSTMTNGNLSLYDRRRAYDQLVAIAPQIAGDINKEMTLTTKLADTINNKLIPAIIQQAVAKGYADQISQVSKDRAAEMITNIDLTKKYNDALASAKGMTEFERKAKSSATILNSFQSSVVTSIATFKSMSSNHAFEGIKDDLDISNAKLGEYNKKLGELTNLNQHAIEYAQILNKSLGGGDDQKAALQDHVKALDAQLALTADGSAKQKELRAELDRTNAELKKYDTTTHTTKAHIDALTKSSDKLAESFRETAGLLQGGFLNQLQALQQNADAAKSHLKDLWGKGGAQADIIATTQLLQMLNYQISQTKPIDLESAKGLKGETAKQRFSADFHEATKGAQDRAAGLYDQIGIAGDLNKSKDRRKDEAKDQVKYEQELNREFNRSYSIMNKLVGGPMDNFVNALFQGDNAMEALGNGILDIVKNLAAAVIKAGIFSAIMSAINPLSFAPGGGFMGILGKLLPFASGGIVTGPTPALIGEAGPEAVVPLNKLGSIMGNRDLNVNVRGDIRGRNIKLANDRESEFQKR